VPSRVLPCTTFKLTLPNCVQVMLMGMPSVSPFAKNRIASVLFVQVPDIDTIWKYMSAQRSPMRVASASRCSNALLLLLHRGICKSVFLPVW